jgi:hypothetical protein
MNNYLFLGDLYNNSKMDIVRCDAFNINIRFLERHECIRNSISKFY